MDTLRVGIIGFGRIGAEHARWLAECPDIRAVAVADPTPARQALARKRGLVVHESPEALLADQSINTFLVATPTSMHFDHASAALNSGRHVMVEKPMALNLAEANRLVELARAQKRALSVFHNRRWDADYLAVKAAIASGAFGRIFNIESRLGQWASCVGPAAPEYRPGWRNEAAFGGGGLFDWGSHFIDQLWRLMLPAKPMRIFAQLRHNIWSPESDDLARVCLDFDDSSIAIMEINTTTTHPLPRWHIDGQNGSAQSPPSLEFDVNRWAELMFTSSNPGSSPRRLPQAPPGLSETQIWNRFADAALDRGAPAVTAESVLPTMALLDAARESSRLGKSIELPQSIKWIV